MLYKEYKPKRWVFYDGNRENLKHVTSQDISTAWYKRHELNFQEVEVTYPPNKKVIVKIPIVEDWEPDDSLEEYCSTNRMADHIIRVIVQYLCKDYQPTKDWWFMKRLSSNDKRMDTRNMEVLQLMKEVIVGNVRYNPLTLYYTENNKKVERELKIVQNFDKWRWLPYVVWWKQYYTKIYWTYETAIRNAMFPNSHLFDLYWWHQLEYYQRVYDLNYGQTNYLCASRDSWKTLLLMYLLSKRFFKDYTFLDELNNWVPLQFVILKTDLAKKYSKYLDSMFYNLLVKEWGIDPMFAWKIAKYTDSNYAFKFKTKDFERTMDFISVLSESNRWVRTWGTWFDESNYLKNFDKISGDLSDAGISDIHFISTISSDSDSTEFFKSYSKARIKSKSHQPIEEVLHYLWRKYEFHKVRDEKDYKEMMEARVFENARAELFELRPTYGQETTIDDIDRMTQRTKNAKITKSMNSANWYAWVLAELYCQLVPKTPALKYKPNIINSAEIPKFFDKIYMWFDEADWYDNPALVIGWYTWWRLFIVDSIKIPVEEDARVDEMKKQVEYRSKRSALRPEIIVDTWRWIAHFREVKRHIDEVRYAFAKNANWKSYNKVQKQKINVFNVGRDYLIKLVNVDLLWWFKVYISSDLSNEWWLMSEMDKFVKHKSGTIQWKKKTDKDDQVNAFLMACFFCWYDVIKDGRNLQPKDNMTWLDRTIYENSVDRKKKEQQKKKERVKRVWRKLL